MILYHGSYTEVKKPDISFSRRNLDFGRGFYVTPIYEQARKWSLRFKKKRGRSVVSEYFSGLIDKYSAIARLKYEKPNLQLCFCSQEILDKYLKYQGCEVI